MITPRSPHKQTELPPDEEAPPDLKDVGREEYMFFQSANIMLDSPDYMTVLWQQQNDALKALCALDAVTSPGMQIRIALAKLQDCSARLTRLQTTVRGIDNRIRAGAKVDRPAKPEE